VKLLEAPNQESKLRLKTGSRLTLIKGVQKGVVLRLHNALGVQALGQHARQRALTDSHGTFHCNVAGQLKKIGHGIEGFAWQDIPAPGCTQLRKRLTGKMIGDCRF
jgi:hypothetical protein